MKEWTKTNDGCNWEKNDVCVKQNFVSNEEQINTREDVRKVNKAESYAHVVTKGLSVVN